MQDAAELRRRLSRLGRQRPKQRPSLGRSPAPAALPTGVELTTPSGPAYRIEDHFPLEHTHGSGRLADLLGFDQSLAAEVAGRPDLRQVSFERLAFLDTETTGLAGGAGTLVFLVGIGTFEQDGFRLRQYFLRTPEEEAGMLAALQEDLEHAEGFVTFNGQAFDLPLLEMRYLIGLRRRWRLTEWPHLDLLHPARRLWRRVLPDCSLSTLERQMLGIARSEADVPGALIPSLYLDYLNSGDAGSISRVLYHNAIDVLTLVGLTTQVLQRHQQASLSRLSGAEALAIGRWHQSAGRITPAEEAFRLAVDTADDPEGQVEALRRFSAHLKRQGRWEGAIEGWRTWHSVQPRDPEPCLELAKYYEWQQRDLGQARQWAEAALIGLTHWEPGWRRDETWEAIQHRLERLARKSGGSS